MIGIAGNYADKRVPNPVIEPAEIEKMRNGGVRAFWLWTMTSSYASWLRNI